MRLIDADALKEKLFIADDNWNPVVTANEIDNMPTIEAVPVVIGSTSKELHEQAIIPFRKELERLKKEYRDLYRKECGEKIGEKASCRNCAMSCVLSVTDHNSCMGGKCTCCNDWCYGWTPENDVSAFLRKNYHYDDSTYYGLTNIFGNDFLKKCNTPQKASVVMEVLQLIEKMDGKAVSK